MAEKATDSFTFSYILCSLTFSIAPSICRWINRQTDRNSLQTYLSSNERDIYVHVYKTLLTC